MAENGYSAKDIIALSGAEGVRKRPAMYIGSTSSKGYTHLLYEVLDNAIDEAQAGHANHITITLSKEDDTDVAEVTDNGRGIPVDLMEKEGKPALEVIMTSLHAGGKFNNTAYKVSGGLHGVGLTVVNALSDYTDVTVRRNGKVYNQKFSRGMKASELEEIGESETTGTTIRFKPDITIFSTRSFGTIELTERLKELGYLNPGIKLTLIDKRDPVETVIDFSSQRGIPDFLDFVRGKSEALTKQVIISRNSNNMQIDLGMQYVNTYSEDLLSFVNKIRTPEGGTHVVGFRTALTRAITQYMQKNAKKFGRQSVEIEGEDTREGLIAIISVSMPNPEFEGQTKEKLGNSTVKSIVDGVMYSAISTFLEENPAEAMNIIRKIIRTAEVRESARRARELARKKNMFEGALLPGKLADCSENDPVKSEIFLVEGESAAGSSKQARDRNYQAILPLKGKILNVEKASEEKLFNNAEIHLMVTAFGTGIKESFNIENLRYHKIIFLTDADVDGSHIRTLLLTFFYRYMRPLIEKGHIYIALPPLYRVSKGKEHKYLYSDAELNKAMEEYEGKAAVQRYKGLGEMNPEQLWETTMNTANRKIKRVNIKDGRIADAIFTVLMGMEVEPRRKFLEEHSNEVSFLDI